VRLKPDKVLRDRFFTRESYSHPAKGHLGLWWEIFQRYTQPGDLVLDPLAGVGASLLGAVMGRNIICVELESHFVAPMKASWAKMRQSPMLGCELGQVVILRGDARCLPLGRADYVVTSPPYEGSQVSAGNVGNRIKAETWGMGHSLAPDRGYIRAQVDAVVTAPPYDEGLGHGSSDRNRDIARSRNIQDGSYDYSRPQVDAVVTSPPYEGTRADGSALQEKMVGLGGFHAYTNEEVYRWHTERDQTNIGNQRGEKYWESMRQVYTECHRVLYPGGLLILVLKGFTRDSKYVDLPLQTRQCCEALGFRFVEQWERELWGLSFWRILQKRRDPAAFDDRLRYEQVLVMERG